MYVIRCSLRRNSGYGHATPKYVLAYWLFWVKALKETANSGKYFLWIPFTCLKTNAPKGPYCHNSPLQEFHQPGKIDSYFKRSDWKLTPYSDKPCHKLSYFPPILLKSYLSFLKMIYFFLNCLHTPPSSSIMIVYKPSNLCPFGVFIFFPVTLLCIY